jgi:ribosomal protein S18 acetylase RimI-like enzyme
MALSYPSDHHRITGGMRDLFPGERLNHLKEFYSSRVEDSWYLDAICVIQTHRRMGIGEHLISLTKKEAVENGYDALSLIAFTDNTLALPLYERTGFQVVRRVPLPVNEFIRHPGGCFLMRCDLAAR